MQKPSEMHRRLVQHLLRTTNTKIRNEIPRQTSRRVLRKRPETLAPLEEVALMPEYRYSGLKD
jgi:hypothetical protein